MMAKERADLQNIARRLQVISDELNGLKKAIGGSAIEQAALSAAMALAWIDLLAAWKLSSSRASTRKNSESEPGYHVRFRIFFETKDAIYLTSKGTNYFQNQ